MFYSFSLSFRLLCCICAVRSDVETIERERRMPSGHVAQGEAGGKKMAKRKKKKEEEEEKKNVGSIWGVPLRASTCPA